MIRVMTLANGEQPDHATKRWQQGDAPAGQTAIDILCCQFIRRSMDGDHDLPRTFTQSLGLTCSCFAANRLQHTGKGRRTNGLSGLAIMVGSGVWMLNSGSFPVSGEQEGEETIAQFALVRKNGASILVLNLQIGASAATQLVQLRALFSHPLLKEQYGAVVLCADQPTAVSAKALQALASRSNLAVHRSLLPASPYPGKGMICLLTAREQAAAAVTIGSADALPAAGVCGFPHPGLTIEFEMKRIVKDKNNRPYLPLSFREQWLGGKDKFPAAFAA